MQHQESSPRAPVNVYLEPRYRAAHELPLTATSRFFAESQPEVPQEIELDDHERSVDGMISLGLDHMELQRNLHQDYMEWVADLSRDELEARLESVFAEINMTRKEPIDIAAVDRHVLHRMGEPQWAELSPADIAALPDEEMQDRASELQEVAAKLAMLSEDETIRTAAHEHFAERMKLAEAAHGYLRVEQQRDSLAREMAHIEDKAALSGRALDRSDKRKLGKLQEKIASLNQDEILATLDDTELEVFQRELARLVRRNNARELKNGLLITEDMQVTINELRPALAAGEPILLVGDTGGAKSALARHLGYSPIKGEAIFVSFHGNINEYQLDGKYKLSNGSSEFDDGPLVRAMKEGRKIIFDEWNAAPEDFQTGANNLLLLKPGDPYTPKTDGAIPIVIQPGFGIIATMNEKSDRYKGRVEQGADAKERWLKIKRIPYPDSNVVSGHTPPDNFALAEAVLADDIGELAVDLPDGMLESFVRAAHETQKVFSGNFDRDEDLKTRVSSANDDRLRANKPGLKGAVLSPRRISKLLGIIKNAQRDPAGTLTRELASWVEGVESPADRTLLTHIISNHTYRDGEGHLMTLLGEEKKVSGRAGGES